MSAFVHFVSFQVFNAMKKCDRAFFRLSEVPIRMCLSYQTEHSPQKEKADLILNLKERLAKLKGTIETLHTKSGGKKALDQGAKFSLVLGVSIK
jgi:hypothetical protein